MVCITLQFIRTHFILLLFMGNQICCEDARQQGNPIENIQSQEYMKHLEEKLKATEIIDPSHVKEAEQSIDKPHVIVPQLYPYVRQTLDKHNFFGEEMHSFLGVTQSYGSDVYEGAVDNNTQKPEGFGKMHKSDGSLYIGFFSQGKAQGKGVLIFPNGSYFVGVFINNKANCYNGYYQSEELIYSGGFEDNVFSGFGKEQGANCSFEGTYVNGKRSQGTLKWKDNKGFVYFYTGTFNQNEQFHGKGILAQSKGVYEGDFVNGVKQGSGFYKGVNGVKYRGQYKGGVKQGQGIIYNNNDTISYKGEFQNGLPHGKGTSYVNDIVSQAQWIEGIDQIALQNIVQ